MDKTAHKKCRILEDDSSVLVRNFSGDQSKWIEGTVLRKLGLCHYEVLTNNGQVLKRHIDQLIDLSKNAHTNTDDYDITTTHIPLDNTNTEEQNTTTSEQLQENTANAHEEETTSKMDSVCENELSRSIRSQDIVCENSVSEKRYPDRIRKMPSYLKDYVT